eukprot:TRINITY_DN22151_c0_g1_i2.p1 TRINITY_DN22151_c0_g1~~TRINITY_DN22151_c0_g1_i2.p1  ORF type:complete len:587 (-),score=57.84 TRINITY_DN22151_c0_g1_i2:250-2010(-)
MVDIITSGDSSVSPPRRPRRPSEPYRWEPSSLPIVPVTTCMSSSGAQRVHSDDLPPPFLRYHNSNSSPTSGRAPVVGNGGLPIHGTFRIPRMPTAEELAVNAIPQSFRCPLCLDVLDQPTTTTPCGHTFCERCILQSLENVSEGSPTAMGEESATRCPVCRSVIRRDHLGPTWIVRELIEEIKVRCDYGVSFDVQSAAYEAGVNDGQECPSTFRLADRTLHLQECPFVLVPCKYEKDGCIHAGIRRQIRVHEQDCPFRSANCEECGERMLSRFLVDHEQTCPSVEVRCPQGHQGCQHICRRGDLSTHLTVCPFELLKDVLLEKDRQVAALQKKVNEQESKLWTQVKQNTHLEETLAALRSQLGLGSTPGQSGGSAEPTRLTLSGGTTPRSPRRSSSSFGGASELPGLARFDLHDSTLLDRTVTIGIPPVIPDARTHSTTTSAPSSSNLPLGSGPTLGAGRVADGEVKEISFPPRGMLKLDIIPPYRGSPGQRNYSPPGEANSSSRSTSSTSTIADDKLGGGLGESPPSPPLHPPPPPHERDKSNHPGPRWRNAVHALNAGNRDYRVPQPQTDGQIGSKSPISPQSI